MLELSEFHHCLLTHPPNPAGPIPTVHDPEGIYPYESFVETCRRPVLQRYRFVSLENDFLRVTLCPDLGGFVRSILDKRSGQESLFVPRSICPVRILPRLGFIPGGIEVSFPVSHTPVQLETVAYRGERRGDRLYVCCGERELRFGLQWTVEYSLGAGETFLTQRTLLRNPTSQAHPWMSWSNAAVPARPDTEFHFPGGPVLCHGAELETVDWASAGPRRVADVRRMTGFFWLNPDGSAFGAFTPSFGQGLYHVADAALAPGMKLWTYGVGPHERWARVASLSGEIYVEIQAGPLGDQSVKAELGPGAQQWRQEFWLPSAERLDLRALRKPEPVLRALSEVPWFDWPPREGVRYWLSVRRAHEAKDVAGLPAPPEVEANRWAPSGMDDLGEALRWAISATSGGCCDRWRFQLGAWLAARGQVDPALEVLELSRDDQARALAGRLYRCAKQNARAAADALRAIECEAVALHPQVMIERDLALAELRASTLAERAAWFTRADNAQDEWLRERRAAWLADQGRFAEACALLETTPFQLVHQRYERTRLWQRIRNGLGLPTGPVPEWLGEDDLASFGAYREFEARG